MWMWFISGFIFLQWNQGCLEVYVEVAETHAEVPERYRSLRVCYCYHILSCPILRFLLPSNYIQSHPIVWTPSIHLPTWPPPKYLLHTRAPTLTLIYIYIYLSVYLSDRLSFHPPVRPFVRLPTYLPTYPPIYLLTYLPTHLSIYSPTYLPTYLSTHLPTYPPIYPLTYLPTHLSIHSPTYLPTYLSTHIPTYLSFFTILSEALCQIVVKHDFAW